MINFEVSMKYFLRLLRFSKYKHLGCLWLQVVPLHRRRGAFHNTACRLVLPVRTFKLFFGTQNVWAFNRKIRMKLEGGPFSLDI
jgi:hypothetical protein